MTVDMTLDHMVRADLGLYCFDEQVYGAVRAHHPPHYARWGAAAAVGDEALSCNSSGAQGYCSAQWQSAVGACAAAAACAAASMLQRAGGDFAANRWLAFTLPRHCLLRQHPKPACLQPVAPAAGGLGAELERVSALLQAARRGGGTATAGAVPTRNGGSAAAARQQHRHPHALAAAPAAGAAAAAAWGGRGAVRAAVVCLDGCTTPCACSPCRLPWVVGTAAGGRPPFTCPVQAVTSCIIARP